MPLEAPASLLVSALEMHSGDRREIARKARETTILGFENQVDPEGTMTAEQRRELGLAAYRDHMRRLALRSGRTRRALRRERELHAEARRLAEARQRCAHVWPDVLDVDSACMYCELPYGEWSA